MTPLRSNNGRNELSQCSTFDNVTPIRVDQDTGAATYITQMAQVDMDMQKKKNQEDGGDICIAPPMRSHSELKMHSQFNQLDKNNLSN